MVKLFQTQLEHYEKVQGDALSLEGKANQLGRLVRGNLPAAMQGFAVVPLFAGYDHGRERGRVFSYDVTGGRYEEVDFQAQGSGSVHARNWIKAGWREGMTADDTIELAHQGAVRRRRRRHRHRRSRPRARHLPDRRRDRRPRLPGADRRRRRRDQPHAARRPRAGRPRVVSMPFYVSPEQVMKDRADYARKGIARGRSLVAFECTPGVLIVADNPSRTLSKISEIYDRIAFAAVGKYNEFQMLRVAGVRHADMKGFSYSREDVSAKELANAYAQTLGQVFTHEMKPYEVELLVAEVGGGTRTTTNEMYHILYDGVVMDEQDYSVLGGNAEQIIEALKEQYTPDMDLGDGAALGAKLLGPDDEPLTVEQLEVALLDRERPRRAFRRIKNSELEELLAAS